jgi:hypothetical protein
MFNATPLTIIKAQRSDSQGLYVLTASTGLQVAVDDRTYPTKQSLIDGITSGEAGNTTANAVELFKMIGGPDALTELAKEIASLSDLVTVYEA